MLVRNLVYGFLTGISIFTFAVAASPCESAYREAYRANSAWTRDAAQIYQIYLDARVGVEEAYLEALPIFRALNVEGAEQSAVLQEIIWMMRSGDLCENGIRPITLVQLQALLKTKHAK